MITTHKIGEISFDDSFALLAIHSGLESYKLVYELNGSLKTHLRRTPKDLSMPKDLNFPVYHWEDELNDRMWTLFVNQCHTEIEAPKGNLFSNEPTLSVSYLVPERKEVDYFLKIEQDYEHVAIEVLKKIMDLPNIITAYTVQEDAVKSRLNLIY